MHLRKLSHSQVSMVTETGCDVAAKNDLLEQSRPHKSKHESGGSSKDSA